MNSDVGRRIKQKRRQMGLTLKELAGNRVTAAQISAIENGKCNPSPKLLEYIAERLQVNIDYFTLTEEERCIKNFENFKKAAEELVKANKIDEAVEILNKSNAYSSCLTDEQKGYYFYINGESLYIKKQYSAAFDFYVKSLTYYLKTTENHMISDTYIKVGNCLFNSCEHLAALGYYISGYQYANDIEDFDAMARSLYNISLCYLTDEKYKLAEEKAEECLNLINTNSWEGSKRFLSGLEMISGAINHKKNEINEGYGKFKKAFLRYKECDDKSGMGRAMNNIALCLWNMNKLEDADRAFKEALKFKESCNDRTLADTYINYSEFLKEQVDINKAFDNILNAEEKMLQMNDKEGTLKIFIEKFKYTCEMGDFDKAEVYGFIALDYSQKLGNKKAEAEIYIKLSEMYKEAGDFELSVEYALKARELATKD
ncbi:MAG TPA: hypothetical protein DDW58_01850 [Clostridiaceae bacterium]|mgnify:FL=1|jgi:transcriptional regulator with XRE-family HTH domain|nr:hypothetical protein [Clostridiaceae bacterium]